MKTMRNRILLLMLLTGTMLCAQNRWNSKRVAIIGDSISDSTRVGTTRCWWEYLTDSLNLKTTCYAKNGATIQNMQGQVDRMLTEEKRWDLIILFGGTNDFNGNVPLGDLFIEKTESTNKNGETVELKHRAFNTDNNTFCGRLNNLLSKLKEQCPDARLLMLTPVHRGFAQFGNRNVQPDELWANTLGLYLDDYIAILQQASRAWAIPLVDTNVESGLLPMYPSYDNYIHKVDTDRLHPNANGHQRIEKAVQGYLETAIPY